MFQRDVSGLPGCARPRRRMVLSLACAWLGLVAGAPAPAQTSAKVHRIGLLTSFSRSDVAGWYAAFRDGLRQHGWIEGKNIALEHRYADGDIGRLHEHAAELVRRKVDVIVATTGPDALAARKATLAIPIVVAAVAEPLASGLVKSLARPGGNVTGLSQMLLEMAGKRLELLKEVTPNLTRAAVLWNPRGAIVSGLTWKELQLAAPRLGIGLHSLPVTTGDEIRSALDALARAGAGALFVAPDPMIYVNLPRIAAAARELRLPSIFHVAEFPEAGGLASYGPDRSDMFRRSADLVDKILKGARPADLPIEQPTKFELVINARTARALGITIPPAVMVRVDRFVE